MTRFFSNLPRPVLISLIVSVVMLAAFALLVVFLGGARDDAFAENIRLKQQIDGTNKSTAQLKSDKDYVLQHVSDFESLLQGTRLIPHTRRAAVQALEESARAQGLTGLNYGFGSAAGANALQSVINQPASGDYRVSVEDITLKVGAPTDGAIYRFLADINDTFPGSAVIQSATITRASTITDAALSLVSEGKDSQLVQGDVLISWRTAQAQQKKEAGKDK